MTKTFLRTIAVTTVIAIALPTLAVAQSSSEIDFGDNSSEWASDGECDDARFIGEGVSVSLVTENIGRDASDCRAAAAAGKASLNPLFAPISDPSQINFGDNTSEYANNDVCDDIRFTGEYAAATIYIFDDIGHDADDCRAALEAGTAFWQGNDTQPNNGASIDDLMEAIAS